MIYPSHYLFEKGIIKDYIDKSIQSQQAGVDLTLKEVHSFTSPGKIDFDNKERVLSTTKKLEFGEDGWLFLKNGVYKVLYNEYVNVPENAVGIAFTRSSLLRSGVFLQFGLWDPGYHGRSESVLYVANPQGVYFKKNARIAQLIFVEMKEKPKSLYQGIYKGENKE